MTAEITFDLFKQFVEQQVPQVKAIGAELVAFEPERVRIKVPFREEFVGNPDTGVLHGGLITVMLDTVTGFSVFCRTRVPEAIVTLDLRIDYLRPSEREMDIYAEAECYKVTRSVAFARGTAFQKEGDPIAHVTGTFLRGTAGPPLAGQGTGSSAEASS